MNENVKQHAVSKFYIRQFTDSRGLVHAVRVKEGHAYKARPAGVSYERECFTIFTDHERELSCDSVNNKFENHCAPLIASLRPDICPTLQQFQAIWMLASNSYTRSRRVRDETRAMLNKSVTMIEEMAPILSDSTRPAALAGMLRIDPNLRNNLNEAEKLNYALGLFSAEFPAEALATKPCKILVAPADVNFVTSDDPVVVVAEGRIVAPSRNVDLLYSEDVEVYFTLSPRLACHWGPGQNLDWFSVADSEVERINLLIAHSAYKELYACRPEDLEPYRAVD